MAIVAGLLLTLYVFRSNIMEWWSGPAAHPATSNTAFPAGTGKEREGTIAAAVADSAPAAPRADVTAVRAQRLRRFQLDAPKPLPDITPTPAEDITEPAETQETVRATGLQRSSKYALQLVASSDSAAEVALPAVVKALSSVSAPAGAEVPTAGSAIEVDPSLASEAANALLSADHDVSGALVEPKTCSEAEQAQIIFGVDLPVSGAELSQILLREPITERALSIACQWWLRCGCSCALSVERGHATFHR